MKKLFLSFLTLMLSATLGSYGQSTKSISSPNGQVRLGIGLTEQGEPTYELTYKGKPVIDRKSVV